VQARAALGTGGIGVTIFEPNHALVDRLQEALDALGDRDDALRVRLLARLATELAYERDSTRREAASVQAVSRAREHGDQAVLAAALGAHHVALWGPDHAQPRLQCASEMLAAARQAAADELELQARNWRALDLLELGHGRELRAEIDAFAALAARARLPSYSWYVPMWRATVALMEGRIEAGMQLALTVREMGQRAGDANSEMCFIHHRFTRLMMDDRHIDALGEFYASDVAYATQKLASPAAPAYRATLAWLLASAGREDEAKTHLALVSADDFSAIPRDVNWMAAASSAADACLLLRDTSRARTLFELMEPFADRMAVSARGSAFRGSMSRLLGQLAAMLDDNQAADAYFTRAEQNDERAGAPVWLAHDLWRHGELLLGLGDERAGTQLLNQASDIASSSGLENVLGRIQAAKHPVRQPA
jgi:hypothetical protein